MKLGKVMRVMLGILAIAATLVPVMTEAAPQYPYETRLSEGSSFLSSAP